MPSPSKAKGSSWERDVADFLSKTYGESFIRTPSSGAYVGGSNAHRKEFLHEGVIRVFKGDIVPPPDWKHFNSEAKFYKDFAWHQLYTGKNAILDSWIEQQFDAADEGDFNIMFLKFNRQGKFVAVESSFLGQLNGADNYMQYYSNKHDCSWVIMNFEKFFEHNSKLVRTLSKAGHKLENKTGTQP